MAPSFAWRHWDCIQRQCKLRCSPHITFLKDAGLCRALSDSALCRSLEAARAVCRSSRTSLLAVSRTLLFAAPLRQWLFARVSRTLLLAEISGTMLLDDATFLKLLPLADSFGDRARQRIRGDPDQLLRCHGWCSIHCKGWGPAGYCARGPARGWRCLQTL